MWIVSCVLFAFGLLPTIASAQGRTGLTKVDLSEYGMAYHRDDCVPDPQENVCEPVLHSRLNPDDSLPSFYKRLKVSVAGAPTFFYIRVDHLSRLPGGLPAVLTNGVFGPFPAGATVKVRKGANYFLVWKCSGHPDQSLLAITSDASDQSERISCP